MTDHMLIMHYEPEHGWSAPEIKPYGPLSIDPASSCLQYCPNVFEGMKVRLKYVHLPFCSWTFRRGAAQGSRCRRCLLSSGGMSMR